MRALRPSRAGGAGARATAAFTLALAACALVVADSASAKIAPTLHDPGNCAAVTPGPDGDAWLCDDGTPAAGGTDANADGAAAITVPAGYRGYRGLPRKAADAATVPGADANGRIALDVDVTLPAQRSSRRGYPLLFFMHGCCGGNRTSWEADSVDAGGEKWHYSNAWFASRGYAVVNYTARGFVNGEGEGSTGETHLDSRSYEINDYQSLACQLHRAGRKGAFDDVVGGRARIDPRRVVVTGGSYGGGFSWMAFTDPRWRCGAGNGVAMRLAAAAPKYGWTDLVHSLVPTGAHRSDPGRLPSTLGCDSGPIARNGDECMGDASPVGLPKSSILAGLYATGKGVVPGSNHTTFPPEIDEAMSCLEGPYPPETNPDCDEVIAETLPQFLRERSAYYQQRFFRKIRNRPAWRVPVFSAGTFTDPLFPPIEHRRMLNRLRETVPGYPIQSYHGDYQHFVQNKPKEWGDLCGADHHVCVASDYPGGDLDARPTGLARTGATTRLNRFIDHYARPRGNRAEPKPDFDVTAALQICPENAGDRPPDEPGPTFTAHSFEALAPGTLEVTLSGSQTTLSKAVPNLHAVNADPVGNQQSNGGRCALETLPAGPGVATYTSDALADPETMIGSGEVRMDFSATPGAQGAQLDARLYDVLPGGTAVLVDRGPHRLSEAELADGSVLFELQGNGWRFGAGHSIRLELAQDDSPYVAFATPASSLTLEGGSLELPVRGQGTRQLDAG